MLWQYRRQLTSLSLMPRVCHLSCSPQPPAPGPALGGLRRRIKVLGQCSFGKAVLVWSTEADELCPVKHMATSMMGPKRRVEAVKGAMLLMSKVVCMTGRGRLCIVMVFADGGDVRREIMSREGGRLPEPQILEWFARTRLALKGAHDCRVLRRDLKALDVFFMATVPIKLGDVGTARVLDDTRDFAKTMVGTPYYLSPEIIEDRPCSFESGIWSPGAVLCMMTTLKHPSHAGSMVTLASKILEGQYPLPDGSCWSDRETLIRCTLSEGACLRPSVRGILEDQLLLFAMNGSRLPLTLCAAMPGLRCLAWPPPACRPEIIGVRPYCLACGIWSLNVILSDVSLLVTLAGKIPRGQYSSSRSMLDVAPLTLDEVCTLRVHHCSATAGWKGRRSRATLPGYIAKGIPGKFKDPARPCGRLSGGPSVMRIGRLCGPSWRRRMMNCSDCEASWINSSVRQPAPPAQPRTY